MAKREPINIGDLVSLIPYPTGYGPTYASQRNVGVVVQIIGDFMCYVKWVNNNSEPCWYQKRTLIKLNNQENKNKYLTNPTQ